jgi:hypothetical protein
MISSFSVEEDTKPRFPAIEMLKNIITRTTNRRHFRVESTFRREEDAGF